MRYIVAFGRFWYDFLVGDRPVLFMGPVLGLAIVAGLLRIGWQSVAGLLLVGLVVASAAWALLRDVTAVRPDP